jgi:hypothetical protein
MTSDLQVQGTPEEQRVFNSDVTISELNRAYRLFNEHIFNNYLEDAYIIVTSTAKQKANGYFTVQKVWTDVENKIERHEIGIGAEYMNRPLLEIMRTLLHEMVHLYCESNEIQDTSRQNRYHNKKFKKACEENGMFYPEGFVPDDKYGWSAAQLTPETVELVKSWEINEEAFKLYRKRFDTAPKGDDEEEKKPRVLFNIKHMCPKCFAEFKAPAPLNVTCNECEEEYLVME